MALVIADRVQDTTSTTGTGAVSLDGSPPAGYQSFAAIGNGNTTYYTISGGSEWEVGIGTYNSTGATLNRDTVLSSSNGGALVNFSAGTKVVFVTYPAERSVNQDAAGNVNISITGNAATATKAFNLNDGTAGAIPYQSASNVTAFLSSASGVLVGGNPPSFSTAPTLTGTNFTNIPNAALTNSSVTLGTTSVALGATATTLAGLTSVTLTQDPTTSLQAATKQYVDNLVAAGIHYHSPVKYEAPTALTATYNNGSGGIGATLTNSGTLAAFTPDGVVADVNDRVLIYQQVDATQNGVYVVTTVGDGITPWVLTRASDANTYGPGPTGLGEGSTFYVQAGNTGAGEVYTCTTTGTITFGTTAINFVQISSAQVYSAGTGLTLSGTVFSLTAPVATSLGGTGLTTFTAANRALYSTSSSALTAGTLPAAAGGTGQTTYADGELLIGRTSDGTLLKGTLVSGGSGLTINNGAGSITITNTAPDQTVTLTGGGTTVITGSYPNFNITSNDQYVGTVTSVDISGGTTGLTFTGGPVTTSGAITVGGTLSAANGGTGATSLTTKAILLGNGTGAVQALPVGTAGQVVVSNGTDWVAGAAPGINYTSVKTSNYNAANYDGVLCDTSGGAFTVTLPGTPSSGAQVAVLDVGNDFGTNNLTVGRNGSTIEGLAEDLIIDISSVSVTFVYDGTTWEIFSQIGANGGNVLTTASIGVTVQGYDADLQAIGALTGTSGLLRKTAANTWSLDTSTYLTTATAASTYAPLASPTFSGTVSDGLGKIRAVPQTGAAKTGSYTLTTGDVGTFVYVSTGGSVTIPNSTFAVGDIVSVYNDTTGNITITCSTSTAYIAGTNTNKTSVTLATRGVATILFTAATSCVISGNVT